MIPYDPQNPLSDFRNFLTVVWRFLKLPPPTRRQLAIASYLQYGPKRKVVEAFRGIGKSWITAAFVVWLLYMNPALNVLVVSASKQRSDNFTTFCLRLITEIPLLQHLRPREGQRCSKVSFDVGPAPNAQSASMTSLGITSQLAGSRADIIVADDVEVPNNSATQLMREKLAEAVKEFDAILKPGGQVVYLGTPQTESSLYNLLSARGYAVRIWPVLYPSEEERLAYGERLAPDVEEDLAKGATVGQTTEPARFSMLDLEERRMSYGAAGFALQFMLNTSLSDADRYPLKLRDLVVTSLNPELAPERIIWAASTERLLNDLPMVGMDGDRLYSPVTIPNINYLPYTGCVLAIDPSGRGRDETGYAIVAYLHGNLFLLDAGGLDGYTPATLEKLARLARDYKVKHIVVEANFGDGMFSQLLKPVLTPIYPCGVEEVKHSVQKEKRIIDTLEPVISNHRLVVNRELIQRDFDSTRGRPAETAHRYQLFYQLTRLTRDKGSLAQDDRLDALSIAVAYWTESMAKDQNKAVASAREQALKKELDRFRKHVFGAKKPQYAKHVFDRRVK